MGRKSGWGIYRIKHRLRPGNEMRYQEQYWMIEYEDKDRQKCVEQLENPTYLKIKDTHEYRIIKRIRHRNDKPFPFYRIISKEKEINK